MRPTTFVQDRNAKVDLWRDRWPDLKGGRGTVLGVIRGALINGMTLTAVSPELRHIVRGDVLALR